MSDLRSLGQRQGTSLVVRQFMAIVRNQHVVENPLALKVETLQAEERYCLRCCDVRMWDAAVGIPCPTEGEAKVAVGWCRVCGLEVWSNG